MTDRKPRPHKGATMARVEEEYGQPFWEVVAGYGADGESVHATSLILGYATGGALRHLVETHDMEHLFVAKKHASNGWQANKGERTLAQRAASSANMTKVQAARNDGLMFEFDGHTDTFKGHAIRRGVNYNTAWMRRSRGMTVEQALHVGNYSVKKGAWRND